ncbi:two-component system, chemotaxis family, sensor kinase CheA [uncultured Gammaproteobacteria bacterium]
MALDLSRFIVRFVEEARDHLGRLADGIATLGQNTSDRELINALFRSAHTIKGSSRMLKLITITQTAHKLEDVLGAVRDGQLGITPALIPVLMRAIDALAALVDIVAATNSPAALPPVDQDLCAALSVAAQGTKLSVAAQGAKLSVADPAPTPEAKPGPAIPIMQTVPAANKLPETVRVRLSKLDELVKLQGEVVSSHARMRKRLAEIQALVRSSSIESDKSGQSDLEKRLRHFAQALRDDVLAQELLMDELHARALIMRMLPLAIVFDNAGRVVRDLARSIGKEAECVITGSEIELDRQVIDQLSDPLVHLLRNAVDHGLEPPHVRLAAGKPARGRISLSARQDGGGVVIEIVDDGGGVSCTAIREKAVRKGLLSAEKAAALTDQEAVDLIFLPGFSTNEIITDLSGRGVGLDVVKQCIVDDLQGTVTVDTRPTLGTSFTLRLPLSLAVMRILLVAVDGLPFAFTAQHIAELVRVPATSVQTIADRAMAVIRNEFVPLAQLSALLNIPTRQHQSQPGQPRPATQAGNTLLLVVVKVRGDKLALVVDDLLDERNMVMKPLPDHLRRYPLVSGIVISDSNELVSVLHSPALMELARRIRPTTTSAATATADDDQRTGAPRILVVDDSLNTREIEKDVLEACGFQVTVAEDGLDGLNKALAEPFDAVLTDVEMPNMDGFSLTARLRQEPTYRSRPIIIVTSREREEDKRRGIEVGADAYIVKGDFDQGVLVKTLRSLLH